MSNEKRRVGIVGYGKLGQFLASAIREDEAVAAEYELAFVWNRRPEAIGDEIEASLRLGELEDFAQYRPDLIVEVAHPKITETYGARFLATCDYMVGSPTAFATLEVEQAMRAAAARDDGHGLYIPRGALPGLEEVLRMVDGGRLGAASITMKKHQSSLKFGRELDPPLEATESEREIYRGPLRELCVLAPNNVNTMAVLAMASELGFDEVEAALVADPSLEHHITEVNLMGPLTDGPRYRLDLIRSSPAGAGAVTSTATLTSFLKSMLLARDAGNGVHFR